MQGKKLRTTIGSYIAGAIILFGMFFGGILLFGTLYSNLRPVYGSLTEFVLVLMFCICVVGVYEYALLKFLHAIAVFFDI